MKAATIAMLAVYTSAAVACRQSDHPKESVAINVSVKEPGAKELMFKAQTVLAALGHDSSCFDSQVVDRRTSQPEPQGSRRPAHELKVLFSPVRCSTEYCVEYRGFASGVLFWCLDRAEPTEIQRRAVEIAWSRFSGAPELQTLLPSVMESTTAISVEFVDRSIWEDMRSGKDVGIVDGPMFAVAKSEFQPPVAR